MRPNMMVGALCVMSAAASVACQPSQPAGAAATQQPLKLEAQQPAPKPTAVKAIAKPAAKSPAVSKAVASNDAVPASAPVAEDESISTTITGCLVLRDDGMFQLKDNDGAHAPKARSWKSGFIKKGSATVDVFDAGNRLNLGTHVNHRISISGTLTDRQLRARSLHVTEKECD
jgi:hypothetical protein